MVFLLKMKPFKKAIVFKIEYLQRFMQQTTNQLIAGCKKGDKKSQLQLYTNYCDAMFTIACRYLRNEEDAKDAMQESFIKAFGKINNYESTYTIGAWLKRIVINQCLDVLKKQKLIFEDLDDVEYEFEEESDWYFNDAITKKEVLKAIESLTVKYKLVVQLYLIEGYDHEEISQILQLPIKTSRTHLRRGRLQLQELLNETKVKTNKEIIQQK
ncbi:ECF subfamily RNA polymerase sigma-24 subunit [Cellulophaga geojensis KL-A]|uniref:ECF subfamily RNA polymerase sigma-24 subunit n=2 Tax=Cellulophaga TaxID=104264 RepID=A0ABN0RNW1_9FLAO|nr:ECF subfamily RNA polymerase sigma-24 subunit [Cellulophaga geojensis KL-A]